MGAYTLPDGFTEFDMFAFGSALLVGGRLKKVDWRLAPVKYEQGQTTFLSKRMLGFFLNAISIVAFLRVKEMRTPSNFFVFNLAVADLSLNINGLTAAYASHLRYWPFGQDGCAYHGFQGMIALLASMSFMAVIAWDRYHQYCTRQKLFWSTTLTMCGIIWILSIFWAAVPLMGWGVYDFEPMRTCCTLDYTRGDRDYVTFMLTLLLLYLIFPAFTMVSCYKSIYKQFKKVHHHRFNTSLPTRVMLMCWGPYILMCIYACFQNVKVISPKLRMVLPVVAKTNPIFNALLYSFGNEFYRGGLWNFLTGQKIVEPDLKKSK